MGGGGIAIRCSEPPEEYEVEGRGMKVGGTGGGVGGVKGYEELTAKATAARRSLVSCKLRFLFMRADTAGEEVAAVDPEGIGIRFATVLMSGRYPRSMLTVTRIQG